MSVAVILRLFPLHCCQLLKWGWNRERGVLVCPLVLTFTDRLSLSLSPLSLSRSFSLFSLSLSLSLLLLSLRVFVFFYSCIPKGNEQLWESAASMNRKSDVTSYSLMPDPHTLAPPSQRRPQQAVLHQQTNQEIFSKWERSWQVFMFFFLSLRVKKRC